MLLEKQQIKCKWTICKYLLKMDKSKKIKDQGNSERCTTKQMSKRRFSKKRRNSNEGEK